MITRFLDFRDRSYRILRIIRRKSGDNSIGLLTRMKARSLANLVRGIIGGSQRRRDAQTRNLSHYRSPDELVGLVMI